MLIAESGLVSPLGNRHPASTKNHRQERRIARKNKSSIMSKTSGKTADPTSLLPCTLMCVNMGAVEEDSEHGDSDNNKNKRRNNKKNNNYHQYYFEENPTLLSLTQSTFSDTNDDDIINEEMFNDNVDRPFYDLFCSALQIERNIEDHDRRLNYERISRESSRDSGSSTIESQSDIDYYNYTNSILSSSRQLSPINTSAAIPARIVADNNNNYGNDKHCDDVIVPLNSVTNASKFSKESLVSYFKEVGEMLKDNEIAVADQHQNSQQHHHDSQYRDYSQSNKEKIPTSIIKNSATSIHDHLTNSQHQREQQQLSNNNGHQGVVPFKECVLFTAKICFMVSTFTEAEKFAALPEQPFASFDTSMLLNGNSGESLLDQASTAYTDSLVELSIRDCASSLVLEGFFTGDNYSDEGRAEVCIFRTEIHQKLILCYKDTNKLQDKPVNKKKCKNSAASSSSSKKQQEDYMEQVYPDFLMSYKCLDEQKIFCFIDNMLKSYPSYTLLFTGHSFGAALSTIASVRYATLFPDVEDISCHVFGSPRIASGLTYQNYANNLDNLKVIRFEKSGDPYVPLPYDYLSIGRSVIVGLDNNLSRLKKHKLFFSPSKQRKKNSTKNNDLNSYIKSIEQCDFICW